MQTQSAEEPQANVIFSTDSSVAHDCSRCIVRKQRPHAAQLHTRQVITNGLQPKRGHRHRIKEDILEGGGSEPEITLPETCLVDLPENTLSVNDNANQADCPYTTQRLQSQQA